MPKKLQEITLGVQRVIVVLPVEEQEDVGAVVELKSFYMILF